MLNQYIQHIRLFASMAELQAQKGWCPPVLLQSQAMAGVRGAIHAQEAQLSGKQAHSGAKVLLSYDQLTTHHSSQDHKTTKCYVFWFEGMGCFPTSPWCN
jgi:hypothetical protein